MRYETVIGMEVHVELHTASKMFCACPADHFQVGANEHVCPVCTAQPGALPVINGRALELTAMTGMALHCQIRPHSVFARKNYVYPDLPKGYQISQYELPICEDMRTIIRQQLLEGVPPDQIVFFFRARYGERILANLPLEGFNLLLFGWVIGSVLLMSLGGTWALWRMRRSSRASITRWEC